MTTTERRRAFRFIAVLSFLHVSSSKLYNCPPFVFPSGEISLRLHIAPSSSRTSFFDLQVPIAGVRGSSGQLDELRENLRPQFLAVCGQALQASESSSSLSPDLEVTWSSRDCATDLELQVEGAIVSACPAIDAGGGRGNSILAAQLLHGSIHKVESGHSGEIYDATTTTTTADTTTSAADLRGTSSPAEQGWLEVEAEVLRLARVVTSEASSNAGRSRKSRQAMPGKGEPAKNERKGEYEDEEYIVDLGDEEEHMGVGIAGSTETCNALRRFTHLFMGQSAPALHVLASASAVGVGEGHNRTTLPDSSTPYYSFESLYGLVIQLLEGPNGVGLTAVPASSSSSSSSTMTTSTVSTGPQESQLPSGVHAWRDLCRYALANLEHTVGAGRWDVRAFPEAAAAAALDGAATADRMPPSLPTTSSSVPLLDSGDGDVLAQREAADVRAVRWLLQVLRNTYYGSNNDRVSRGVRKTNNIYSNKKTSSRREETIKNKGQTANGCAESDMVWVVTVVSDEEENCDADINRGDDKTKKSNTHHKKKVLKNKKLAALVSSAAAAGPCVRLEVITPLSSIEEKVVPSDKRAENGPGGEAGTEAGTKADSEAGTWSNDWKPRLLRKHLRHWPRDRLVLFVDGYDVLVSPETGQLRHRLQSANLTAKVVFAAERDCWPDAALCRWLSLTHDSGPPFLNAGVFAGTAGDIVDMLQDMHDWYGDFAFCGEDQRAYQRFYHDASDTSFNSIKRFQPLSSSPHTRHLRVQLDSTSAVFQCMHGHSWHVEIDVVEKEVISYRGDIVTESRFIAVPLLHEVVHADHSNCEAEKGGSYSQGCTPQEDTEQKSHRRLSKRPLVMHFNSFDGKGMMRTLVDAMEQSATQAEKEFTTGL